VSNQDQRISEGAVAVQSGRDTVIQHGLTPAQMTEILSALAAQFPAQIAVAHQIVTTRLAEFEKSFLEKFNSSTNANSEAFADPDFQYVVRASQHAYARSGDGNVRDTLIDLIARRSKEQGRTRLTLTLNEAVEKAALLTKNEFAELSLCYLLRYTMNHRIGNMEQFTNYFQLSIAPLLQDISKEDASYQYLEAQSCGNAGAFGSDLIQILRERYGGIFSGGFERHMLAGNLPDGKKDLLDQAGYVIPCLNDSTKLQIKAINKDDFLKLTKTTIQLNEAELTNVWNMFEATIWNGEDFLSNVEKCVPEIRTLAELWNKSPLNKFTLTTVGIAIGHSNLVRTSKLDADLSIWIK
jgi:hypothetical protein